MGIFLSYGHDANEELLRRIKVDLEKRGPDVCLDELAIAIGVKGGNIQTILVESQVEVKTPPSIGHIQWLDMHDWKQRRVTGGREDW